jgi:hypothetical protein
MLVPQSKPPIKTTTTTTTKIGNNTPPSIPSSYKGLTIAILKQTITQKGQIVFLSK